MAVVKHLIGNEQETNRLIVMLLRQKKETCILLYQHVYIALCSH